MNRRTFIGNAVVARTRDVLAELGSHRVLLVTGRRSFTGSGADRALGPALAHRVVRRFDDFAANPAVEAVERGISLFRDFQPDVVIAVGGGSVIDMAKLVSFFGCTGIAPRDWPAPLPPAPLRLPPLVAIPTTAGSGSEATPFAALFVDGIKRSVEHSALLPHTALVDPELLLSMTAHVTACTGMDALCQAIESYWNVRATRRSRVLARAAIQRILPNLSRAVAARSPASLAALAEGAHLAGRAIAMTRTTACHAISYPLTSRFGAPHGHAVALTLPSMLVFNHGASAGDTQHPGGADAVRSTIEEIARLIGGASVSDARARFEALMDEIGLSRRLSSFGVRTVEDRERVIAEAFNPERVKNNPRCLTAPALRSMLAELV